MSSSNYMDNVPVKIAESYRPPPPIYQLPQSIQQKLALPVEYFSDMPQYCYDFQLERKVLANIPEWRRRRQQNRAARHERKKLHEQQRVRAMEAQQKQLLGAVNYPSAEDLSSASDSEEETKIKRKYDTQYGSGAEKELYVTQAKIEPTTQASLSMANSCFHNILQPTILTPQQGPNTHNNGNLLPLESSAYDKSSNASSALGNASTAPMHLHAFKYEDFENDTSSPFDSIELKTINDLELLEQVLLKATPDSPKNQDLGQMAQATTKDTAGTPTEATEENSNDTGTIIQQTADLSLNNPCGLAPQTAALNYNHQMQQQNDLDIPNIETTTVSKPQSLNHFYQQPQHMPTFVPYSTQQEPQQMYSNQNYLYGTSSGPLPIGNNFEVPSDSYSSVSAAQLMGHNANNYYAIAPQPPAPYHSPPYTINTEKLTVEDWKSRSVPDILKELSEEVRNSEMRRTRNYSYTDDEQATLPTQTQEEQAATPTPPEEAPTKPPTSVYYAKLEASAQKLAKNISLMGFPLERVAKIAQLFGTDEKKIFEHLIPLSELMVLGFDEAKISEALVKFNNNKDRALDYLVS